MKKCKTCWGYGLHYLGEHTPMGRLDALDGMPTQACPECGANPNSIKQKGSKLENDFINFMEKIGVTFINVKSSKKNEGSIKNKRNRRKN